MKLIVGLGNPDDKYKNTYHNLGFMAVDGVARALDVDFSKTKCKALVAEKKIGGEKVILAKPLTYMNLSGESVRELVSFYKIDLKDVLVIYDDYDLNKGSVRIRENGSAGTHNGMRSIVSLLNATNFPRVRIGFKPLEPSPIPLIDYVLSGIGEADKPIMTASIERASAAAVDFAKGEEVQKIMQKYNSKSN